MPADLEESQLNKGSGVACGIVIGFNLAAETAGAKPKKAAAAGHGAAVRQQAFAVEKHSFWDYCATIPSQGIDVKALTFQISRVDWRQP